MKPKLLDVVAALALLNVVVASVANATTYEVTFNNVLIDSNPNYPITGSFLFDDTKQQDPSALYGLSNFNVLAVTPYGTFQMNTVWSADSAFDALGLGISNSSSTPALVLVFSSGNGWNGTGLNVLSQAIANGVPIPLITNGQSNMIPGRSVVAPSIAELYGINYSGFGSGNWPAASNAFPTVSGSLVPSPVPIHPSIVSQITGLGLLGLLAWGGKRKAAA